MKKAIKKRTDVKYLFQSGNRLEIREMTPEVRFVFDLFDMWAVQNLNADFEKSIRQILVNADEENRKLLDLRYGFETREPGSYEKLMTAFGLGYSAARGKTARAVDQLRPFRNLLLKKNEAFVPERIGKDKTELIFLDDLRKIIREEKTAFLQNILKRRNIKIEIQKSVRKKYLPPVAEQFSMLEAHVSELHLSHAAMHELEVCGITQVSQILMKEHLSKLLSETVYHELMEKLEIFRKMQGAERPDYYTAAKIILTAPEQAKNTELLFDGDSINESLVINQIYDMLCDRENDGLNLFDVEIPFRLKNLLLMKGYFYLTDVFKDGEKLLTEFTRYEMQDFLEDLQNLLQHGTVSIACINEKTETFLEIYHIDRVGELTGINPVSLGKKNQKIQEQLINWCSANILYRINGAYQGDMSAILISESGGTEDDRQGTPSAQAD